MSTSKFLEFNYFEFELRKSTANRWQCWCSRLEKYFDVDDPKRKKAALLNLIGETGM